MPSLRTFILTTLYAPPESPARACVLTSSNRHTKELILWARKNLPLLPGTVVGRHSIATPQITVLFLAADNAELFEGLAFTSYFACAGVAVPEVLEAKCRTKANKVQKPKCIKNDTFT